MRNFLIVFSSEVSMNEVITLSLSISGNCTDEYDRVIIEKEGGRIYLDFYDNMDDFEDEEIEFLTEKIFGKEPVAYVSIHIGHFNGSDNLAKKSAATIQKIFNSVIWDDQDIFNDYDRKLLRIISPDI